MIRPSKEIIDQSYVKDYEKLYQEVKQDPEAFWENIAHELLWFKPWNKVLDWNYPYARWFVGGQCNIVYNALDRHQKTPTKDKLAYIWQGQPSPGEATAGKDGPVRTFTYGQLNTEDCKFANVLKSLGVRKGDRISIYLPRIPEQFIAMLASAKIGAIHSVVFSGFSADALKNRIMDAQSKVVITTDRYPYKDKILESKRTVDEAVKDIKSVENIILVRRLKLEVGSEKLEEKSQSSNLQPPTSNYPNYHWYHELMAKADTVCSTEIMDATDPLFLLYTSGSTGKPKGVLHSHAGYMVGTYITLKWVFNLNSTQKTLNFQPQTSNSDEIWFCTADAGWVTGHSYIVYSPLINGATTFVYEATPDYPHPGIWWQLIQKYKITKFYTAPTAIRALMRLGDDIPNKYDLSSLQILGTVGEPINPEAWLWYHKTIGKERCPIMDTWWQTETGMFMLTPLPSVPLKPGSCFKPFFGVEADVVDENGNSLQIQPSSKNVNQDRTSEVEEERRDLPAGRQETSEVKMTKQGYLVIRKPWPAMLLDVYNNPQKYRETYFEKIPVSKKLEVGSEKLEEKSESSNIQSPTSNNFSDFLYFTGDSAKKDEDGYFWIIGRNDDVIKVSGHRLGSAELESAFVAHQSVAEAAVIGKPDEVKGEKIKAFVILKKGVKPTDQLKTELVQQVRKMIGPIATPDEIDFVEKLPKTRSGKIMRRVLKAQELGQPLGDTSTLEN